MKLVIGNEELGPEAFGGDLVLCKVCGGVHPIQFGTDDNGEETPVIGYVRCGEKDYLVSVHQQLVPGQELFPMTKEACKGCYNDDYNHGLGGAKECWQFKQARIMLRRRVGMNDVPPWTADPEVLPNCYRQTGCIFVGPETEA